MRNLILYAVDIGSIKGGNFAWARGTNTGHVTSGQDPDELVRLAYTDLSEVPVAMGFECPLYVPVRSDPLKLTDKRDFEGNRPWSAGAGAGSLTVGIVETIWVLQEIRSRATGCRAFLDWDEFANDGQGLFLWEIFASRLPDHVTHIDVAEAAVQAFARALPDPAKSSLDHSGDVHSLIGTALLHTSWNADPGIITAKCLVIKV